LDFGKFEAETYDYAKDQKHHEEFKGSQGTHVSGRMIEDEDDEDVDDGYSAARHLP
jgi:hypothetical protein